MQTPGLAAGCFAFAEPARDPAKWEPVFRLREALAPLAILA